MTGEVHTVGGRFVVKQPHGRYKIGDVLTVYTYLGEGHFKVWFGGRMYQENLDFSPYGGSAGTRCAVPRYCWGELTRELDMVWWVKLRLSDGRIVWALGNENFSGNNGCG
jgi:hypothetical protein